MNISKAIVILADVSLGAIIFAMGWTMLPFPMNIAWALFNTWIWTVAPLVLYLASKA